MDHIDSKYIGIISPRLENLRELNQISTTFVVPFVEATRRRTRIKHGVTFTPVKTNTNFKCHNCGASMSFSNFLKHVDAPTHKQYSLEKFKEGHTGRNFVVEEPDFKFEAPKFKKFEYSYKVLLRILDLMDISLQGNLIHQSFIMQRSSRSLLTRLNQP